MLKQFQTLPQERKNRVGDIFVSIAQVLLASVALPYIGLDTFKPELAVLGVVLSLVFWISSVALTAKGTNDN